MTAEKIIFLALIALFILFFISAKKNLHRRVKISVKEKNFLSDEQIGAYAKTLASMTVSGVKDYRKDMYMHLDESFSYIKSLYAQLSERFFQGKGLPSAAGWLLDNYYIIEKQVAKLEKVSFSKLLAGISAVSEPEYEGQALIYALAKEYVSHRAGQIDYESLKIFLSSYTSHAYLKSDEIWLFCDMVKLTLIENIAYICKKIRLNIKERDYAQKYARYIAEDDNRQHIKKKILRYFERGRISSSFATEISQILRQQGGEGAAALDIIEEALLRRERSLDRIIADEQSIQSSYQADMAVCIRSIIELENIDTSLLFDDVSEVVRIFRKDIASVYEKMDKKTQQHYVSELCKIAKKTGASENVVANCAISLSREKTNEKQRHVGYYLLDAGRQELLLKFGKKQHFKNIPKYLYFISIWASAFLFGFIAYVLLRGSGIGAAAGEGFFVMLVSTLFTVKMTDDIFLHIKKPSLVPKMDFVHNIPDECRAFVVITTLIGDKEAIEEQAKNLEDFYLLNPQNNLYFAVLADYKDSESEQNEQSESESYLLEKIAELNKKYCRDASEKFFCFIRKKTYSETENRYMGRERKRGAICDFVSLIKRGEGEVFGADGEKYKNLDIKYIITLDSDTRLQHNSAAYMIGAMAHPLNKGKIDTKKNVVTEGYGVMQPHISVFNESGEQTYYTRLYASHSGIDAYSGAKSDIYQDLFGEGIFVGKGIFDADLFDKVLVGRFPKERILSHDLLEGAYLRCALLSDVVLNDSYPKTYLSHLSRLHRWVRGDWQIIGWLKRWVRTYDGKEKNPINALSKYKIFDNLRRSVTVYAKARLIAGCALFEPFSAYIIAAVILLSDAEPLLSELIRTLRMRLGRRIGVKFNSNIVYGAKRAAAEFFINICLIVYETYVMADAVIRTFWRLVISKKHLLSWVTAQQADKKFAASSLRYHFRKMWISPALAAGLIGFALVSESALYPFCALLAIGWALAPYIVYELSKPAIRKESILKDENRALFNELSRRMWGYFEDFALADNNFLPPDNVQFDPYKKIAARTSPTNIGLYLSSVLCARDFGYISTENMLRRIENTLDTIDKLEKWNSHLLNWYSTKTLEALGPKYVSSVDSGNYIASMIMLRQGIGDYKNRPSVTKKHLRALSLTIKLGGKEEKYKSETELFESKDNKKISEYRYALDKIASEHTSKNNPMIKKAVGMALDFREGFFSDKDRISERIDNIKRRIDKILSDTDFSLLYDKERGLFSIGYDIQNEKMSNSYYDLLMSEARQTSYIAIAYGQVEPKHWFRLGRNMARIDNHIGLLSWSGTMFEYLMPLIFMKNCRDTLLDESYNFALREQLKYALSFAPVYGMSESAFLSFDADFNYAYKAIGAPKLALRRSVSDDKVIAPYASLLSAMLAPNTAAENIKNLIKLGAYGPYGVYEAVDFDSGRMLQGEKYAVVKSYMVHHIAMSFLSLGNVFYKNIFQRRFMSEEHMRASAYLLGERIPIWPDINTRSKQISKNIHTANQPLCSRSYSYDFCDSSYASHVLSNKNYMMYIDSSGEGYSKTDRIYINRPPKNDCEKRGFFVFISDEQTQKVYPATFLKGYDKPREGNVTFYPDKAVFFRQDDKTDTKMSIMLCPDECAHIQSVSITNHSDREKIMAVTFYSEIILTEKESDRAHRAFSDMFLSTSFDEKSGCLFAERRSRWGSKKRYACLRAFSKNENCISYETEREKFIGRNNTIETADALKSALPLSNSIGDVTEGVFAMRIKMKISPFGSGKVDFVLATSDEKEKAENICRMYSDENYVIKAEEQSRAYCEIFARYIGLENGEEKRMLDILAYMSRGVRNSEHEQNIKNNILAKSDLWQFGISGDRKFMLLEVNGEENKAEAAFAIKAYRYLNLKGIYCDLVIICFAERGYTNELYSSLCDAARSGTVQTGSSGSVYVLFGSDITEDKRNLFYTAASYIFSPYEIKNYNSKYEKYKKLTPLPSEALQSRQYEFFNGFGGFDNKNDEYVIVLKEGLKTPAPWSNVLSNKSFGTVVTESGGGYSFAQNSALKKLTAWTNDYVSDTAQEIIFIKDMRSGYVFSPARNSINTNSDYIVRHGIGYSVFCHNENGLSCELCVFVPIDKSEKISILSIKNTSDVSRALEVRYGARLLLSQNEEDRVLISSFEDNMLCTKNVYNREFFGRMCYLASSEDIDSYTGGAHCFGELLQNGKLDMTERGGDISALSTVINIESGEKKDIAFIMGEAAQGFRRSVDIDEIYKDFENTKNYWKNLTGEIRVKSGDTAFDIMINGRLLYQSAACRLFARSAFYQCGGAFGFRDQLQDVLAFISHAPAFAKEQILYHSAHQFEQGDVLHWWHDLGDAPKGVRTRFSDDLLWLAYVTAEYIKISGDEAILDEKTPFLSGREVPDGQEQIYDTFLRSDKKATLYEHIMLAINHALKCGAHGILLMGGGDWNDAMNNVGIEGKGESVWLTWFMCSILKSYIPICKKRRDAEAAELFKEKLSELSRAANENAWDGKWYLRAFFDNGEKIGSAKNKECRIDLIAQAWAAISDEGEKEKTESALAEAEKYLIDYENGIIKLLTPPFKNSNPSPGYIQGYSEGMRENGGQYTHGAVWIVMAYAIMGMGDKAHALLDLLNPINHSKTFKHSSVYKKEPYAISADVYTNPYHMGEGGWSFYTGAASWYYKVATEYILGLKKEGNKLFIKPNVKSEWEKFELLYKYENTNYIITALRDKKLQKGFSRIKKAEDNFIHLQKNKGNVYVTVYFN